MDNPTYLQSPMLGFYQSQSSKIFEIRIFLEDLQRVDNISVSHTRPEREPAKDKFEHWIERIKTLHFTSLDEIKIQNIVLMIPGLSLKRALEFDLNC